MADIDPRPSHREPMLPDRMQPRGRRRDVPLYRAKRDRQPQRAHHRTSQDRRAGNRDGRHQSGGTQSTESKIQRARRTRPFLKTTIKNKTQYVAYLKSIATTTGITCASSGANQTTNENNICSLFFGGILLITSLKFTLSI